jgi:hypothetical protein
MDLFLINPPREIPQRADFPPIGLAYIDSYLKHDRGSIGEMGLCVKKNKSQYMGVLGYPVARGIVRDARAGKAGLRGG